MSLAKRIIACLDVKDGKVVKGVRFNQHEVVGDIIALADKYSQAGIDELVFYDISASADGRSVDHLWVDAVARNINIPFCVAGGIRDLATAKKTLYAGADKISINSPAIEQPDLITELATEFGKQCVVVGIDSSTDKNGEFCVYQYTGDPDKAKSANISTLDWVLKVQELGAGEIVLNCMNQDGVRQGYDIEQLAAVRAITNLPLIASGGAGSIFDFAEVFKKADVDGALAASVFHKDLINVAELKQSLIKSGISIRL